ncbi:MAG: hypothetical protein GY774_37975 [Planctomycetes bacterium]|nr:hypothetical protein [Planctomycetota bacterium]
MVLTPLERKPRLPGWLKNRWARVYALDILSTRFKAPSEISKGVNIDELSNKYRLPKWIVEEDIEKAVLVGFHFVEMRSVTKKCSPLCC